MELQQACMDFIGSSYEGDIVDTRKEGNGAYTFSTKTVYIGQFKDDMFHGMGTLYFKNGGRYEGEWENGRNIFGEYIFPDDFKYVSDQTKWEYCYPNDRRFLTEIRNGLQPAGQSQLTDTRSSLDLPTDSYDCGDGYYHPEERVVRHYNMEFRRYADREEHNWILYTCRKGWDEFSDKNNEDKAAIRKEIENES